MFKFEFTKFMVEAILAQLVNFSTLKYFQYQNYLMHIFLHCNAKEFQDIGVDSECQSMFPWSISIRKDHNCCHSGHRGSLLTSSAPKATISTYLRT